MFEHLLCSCQILRLRLVFSFESTNKASILKSTFFIRFSYIKTKQLKISQVMYYKLKAKEVEQEEEARKFIAEYGEEAYIATQKLL